VSMMTFSVTALSGTRRIPPSRVLNNLALYQARAGASWPGPPVGAARAAEAMRAGNTGRVHGEDERRKRSESHKRRGTRPPKAGWPWKADEDELVRTLPAAEVAARTGRILQAVYDRRHELQLPDGRRRKAQ
jgi:hypothetical protein